MSSPAVTPERILQTGLGFFASKTLLSAVELNLFGLLETEPLGADEMQRRLGLHRRAACDFFDALVALGFLNRSGTGEDAKYMNTAETAAFLVPGKPDYLGGLLLMAGRRLYGFWDRLTAGLRTGKAQNEIRDSTGRDPFAAIYSEPSALEEFVDAMTGVQLADFRLFADRFDFGSHKVIADVGGSGAALSMAIARRHKTLRCLSLDLAPVTALAEQRIKAAGLSDRVQASALDFFAQPFPDADVILMGNILHDWGIAEKKMLIGKAWAALPAGGALVVIESVIDDARRENAAALLMSLNMLIETPAGFNFSRAQFETWCRDAGFSRVEQLPLSGSSSALIAKR
jgi:precorrin-6B methylase 2